MKIEGVLSKLCQKHLGHLVSSPWIFESDRFSELAFCIISQYTRSNLEDARIAADKLAEVGLLSATILSSMGESANAKQPIVHILKRYGFSAKEALVAADSLIALARAIEKEYNGKIQHAARKHAESLREELVTKLKDGISDEPKLRHAISLWLQNAFSLPISLERKSVTDFCNQNSIRIQDLGKAADSLDLNLAIVDDIIEIEQARPKLKGKKKKGSHRSKRMIVQK
jgi:hypothetical protein